MVTGFDIFTHDARLRRHWLYRALAFIADAIMIFVPMTFIMWFLDITDILLVGLASCLVFYISSAAVEAAMGATAGKFIFGLRVHSLRSDKVAARILLRNLTRLLWFVLPPLDVALGMATRGDPRQRLLDRLAYTTVVIESERKWHEAHLEKSVEPEEKSTEPAATDEGEPEPVGEGEAAPELLPPEPVAKEEKCYACGGHLIILADEKMQCNDCGLIQ